MSRSILAMVPRVNVLGASNRAAAVGQKRAGKREMWKYINNSFVFLLVLCIAALIDFVWGGILFVMFSYLDPTQGPTILDTVCRWYVIGLFSSVLGFVFVYKRNVYISVVVSALTLYMFGFVLYNIHFFGLSFVLSLWVILPLSACIFGMLSALAVVHSFAKFLGSPKQNANNV